MQGKKTQKLQKSVTIQSVVTDLSVVENEPLMICNQSLENQMTKM